MSKQLKIAPTVFKKGHEIKVRKEKVREKKQVSMMRVFEM